jgi:hypothetical protein
MRVPQVTFLLCNARDEKTESVPDMYLGTSWFVLFNSVLTFSSPDVKQKKYVWMEYEFSVRNSRLRFD